MVDARRIRPSGPLSGTVAAPPSKSVANRALLLGALATGTSRVRGAGDADDVRIMTEGLQALGIGIQAVGDGDLQVDGCAGRIPARTANLSLGNAGTALRFLGAAAGLGAGTYRLDGDPRLRERPLGDLTEALRQLGMEVRSLGQDGFVPVELAGGPLQGGSARLQVGRSSQFLSGLLMAGPCTQRGLDLRLEGSPVSRPYVDLTLAWMEAFGGPPVEVRGDRIRVPGGSGYAPTDVRVEGDASAAAALFAAAAVTGGRVRVTGLDRNSKQPDLAFLTLLEEMGCQVQWAGDTAEVQGGPLRGIRADLSQSPDLAPSLAAVALFADGPTRIGGAPHLRWKESDRIGDLGRGLELLGGRVEEHEDGLTVGPAHLHGARVDPRRDHRLAMAFATVGLVVDGVEVEDPGCVGKSFPGFFAAIDSLRG
jgi:3-phosphoshikimate 1-carboxyvinyltransferase